MSVEMRTARVRLSLQDRPLVLEGGAVPYRLSAALAAAAAIAAGLTLAFPSVLAGEPVMRGNLRGTALVVLVVGVPLLVAAMVRTSLGSARWLVAWVGAVAYLLYQAVMFCFATPLNSFFLPYVAYLGLGVWSAVALLHAVHISGVRARISPRLPVRAIGGLAIVFAALNGLTWLATALPASFTADPRTILEGSGLTTNPVYVQDLAFWVPAMVLAGVWLWQRKAWGALLTGGLLTFFSLECISIAVDQWFGARADDSTAWASMTAVPMFAGLAVVVALPLLWLHRNIDRQEPRKPPAGR
jgi:hypothetical protein